MALALLPDEVKQRIWRYFDALELCRIECVARGISRGTNADAVWKRSAIALLQSERIHARPPIECGLQRQNARRNLSVQPAVRASSGALLTASPTAQSSLAARMSELSNHDNESSGECDVLVAGTSTLWRHCYRDCFVSVRLFDAASAAFEAAKAEIHELKRERGELRELLQSARTKSQSEKHARRVHMSCVRWMNRSHRRQTASESLWNAQSAALTKAELADELARVESALQLQSAALFALRSQYQKRLHRMTTQLARGTQTLCDLSGA